MKNLTPEGFNSALRSNEYGKQYLELVDKIKSEDRGLKREQGYEIHHVCPRSLGGHQSSLIKVSIYEHCILHFYLAKAIPCMETAYPVLMLSNIQTKKLQDIDKLKLEDIIGWTKLREDSMQIALYSDEAKERFRGNANRRWSDRGYRVKQTDAHKGGKSHLGIPVSFETRQKISQTLKNKGCKPPGVKGRIKITKNDGTFKLIFPEELENYLEQGYKRHLNTYVKKGTCSATGKVWVHLGSEDRRVPKSDIQSWLDRGYTLGYSEEHRKHLSDAHKRNTLPVSK